MNRISEILQNHHVKPTAMRTLVLEKLEQQDAAISLSELEAQFDRSDRVTLYRTLKTFEEHGLVHVIDDGTGAPKYALCAPDCTTQAHHDMHVHFHCRQCDTTLCLPNSKIPVIALPGNFEAEDYNLVIQGICADCA